VTTGLPPEVIAAVEHALNKDRALRTANVEGFVAELTGDPLPPKAAAPDHLQASSINTESQLMGDTVAPSRPSVPRPLRPSAPRAPAPARRFSRVAVASLSVVAGVLLGVIFLMAPRNQPWIVHHRISCTPYSFDQLVKEYPPPAPSDRIACQILAGKISDARAALSSMPASERPGMVDAVFTIIDQNDRHLNWDKARNVAMQPIMQLFVEMVPSHDRALFHLAIAEYGHDNASAILHMEQALRAYGLRPESAADPGNIKAKGAQLLERMRADLPPEEGPP
jgi:hypothetical protein